MFPPGMGVREPRQAPQRPPVPAPYMQRPHAHPMMPHPGQFDPRMGPPQHQFDPRFTIPPRMPIQQFAPRQMGPRFPTPLNTGEDVDFADNQMPQQDTFLDDYVTIYEQPVIEPIPPPPPAFAASNPMPQEDFSSAYDDFVTVYDDVPVRGVYQEQPQEEIESISDYETEN